MIFPIFAIVVVGFLAARFRLVAEAEVEALSRFVFVIALPVLLFKSLLDVELPESINWLLLLSYYGVVLPVYALGMWISKAFFRFAPTGRAIYGLGSTFGNMILVGLPIVTQGLGEEALLPYFMIVSIHSATLFLVMTLLIEASGGSGRGIGVVLRDTLLNLVSNPLLIGLALGIAASLAGLRLPGPLDTALETISDAALPVALFALGATLNAYRVQGQLAEAGVMVALKMLLQPALVGLLAFGVFHLDPLWALVAVMAAGMPIGINVFVFARSYNVAIAPVSAAILISTSFAFISQPILLAIYYNGLIAY